MGYFACGDGEITVERDMEIIDVLKSDKKTAAEALADRLQYIGFEITTFEETTYCATYRLRFANNYNEDEVEEFLKAIEPYTLYGEFTFRGDDDEHWHYEYEDDKWRTKYGEVVYQEDLQSPQEALEEKLYELAGKVDKRLYDESLWIKLQGVFTATLLMSDTQPESEKSKSILDKVYELTEPGSRELFDRYMLAAF